MSGTLRERTITTPVGPARAWTQGPYGLGALVLGHGAGGGVEAPDLRAARDAALAVGLGVVLVEQPWRVAGRRVAVAPARLDQAWLAVLADLTGHHGGPALVQGPVVVGGRSAGARVACRTATQVGAAGVLALAFPLHPPGHPDRTRLPELRLPTVPRLVVQGDRDAFGLPTPEPGVEVHLVRGADHGFAVRRTDARSADEVAAEVRAVVTPWLVRVLGREARTVRR